MSDNRGMAVGGCSLRLLVAGVEPALSLAIETALREAGHLVDEEYSIDRVLKTLRRQAYDAVIVYGRSRYLNAVELVRVIRGSESEDVLPAVLVLVPVVNRVDRHGFGAVGADHVIALEGQSLLRTLMDGIEEARKVRLAAMNAPHQ